MVDWVAKLKRELARPFRGDAPPAIPLDFSPFQKALLKKVRPYTMTSNERVAVLESAVRHVVAQNYPGAFVECGVAKGGSTMAMAYTLLELGISDRDLYLYDTFEGMPEPDDVDRGRFGESAGAELAQAARHGRALDLDQSRPGRSARQSCAHRPIPNRASISSRARWRTPCRGPRLRAPLRCCGWTPIGTPRPRAELDHLYPKLVRGGIVIIDDYFRWQGARKAVDEYVAEHKIPIFWVRVDDSSVIGVKP